MYDSFKLFKIKDWTFDRGLWWKKHDLTTELICWSNLREESKRTPSLFTVSLIEEFKWPQLKLGFPLPTEGPKTIASVLPSFKC